MINDVIGLKLDVRSIHPPEATVKVSDLIDWMSSRDAACAEYLVDALRDWQTNPRDIGD